MDANKTRYHALVTEHDWTSLSAAQATPLEWNAKAGGLALRAQLFEFEAAESEAFPLEESGRGGVFDAYGNLYALSLDRRSIHIRSAGSGAVTTFWPIGDATQEGVAAVEGLRGGRPLADESTNDGGFHPVSRVTALPELTLDALAVTSRHYLAVASRDAGGLLVFDLHGAGPPLFQPWPGLGAITALAALDDGGVVVLLGNIVHRLDSSLRALVRRVPEQSSFGPVTPALARAPSPASSPQFAAPCSIDVSQSLPGDATALVVDGARLFVLGRPASAPLGDVWLCVFGLDGQRVPLRAAAADPASAATFALRLNDLFAGVVVDGTPPALACRTIAVCRLDAQVDTLSVFVVAAAGDQAFRLTASFSDSGVELTLEREFWPMRRYAAFGLAALPAGAQLHGYPLARVFYASLERWAPLLVLARPRYESAAHLLTPIWDSGVDGCVWHRLLLDLRLPSGTDVSVETRGADGSDPSVVEAQPWRAEPHLIRSARGREQPWQELDDADRAQGFATFETLLQSAQHRWFQARLTITGDGQRSPALRALRVWYPRFSYARTYLPPIYREDANSADFLDRFLALFEGEFTRWEDRIAAAQLLFDARTAPAATLEWLAAWLGMAFDAAESDPVRRRLLIRYAVSGYARRGTLPGLLLASTLAWETNLDEAWLRDPASLTRRTRGVRLQEFFSRVRPLPADAWQPAQGRAALLARLSEDASLAVPDDATAATSRRAVLLKALGFVPRGADEEGRLWSAWQAWASSLRPLPSDEPNGAKEQADYTAYLERTRPCAPLRRRWQDFLSRRFRRVSALNAAWGTSFRAFERIPSPIVVPSSEAALGSWRQFEAQILRAEPHAHRFRVVLPLPQGSLDPLDIVRRRSFVVRALEREKPAHTVAEVRFSFDLFQIGEARLGLDTQLEAGLARRPELVALSRAVLGRTDIGSARLAQSRPEPPTDRVGLGRGEPFNR